MVYKDGVQEPLAIISLRPTEQTLCVFTW